MLTVLGQSPRVCQGIARRTMLQAGGAGLFGLSVPRLLAAEEARPATTARAKSVIFLFLFGGPSQLETFDMKPDAPSKIRGPFQPIACRTPGLLMCEHLARSAAVSDKFAVLRTLSHSFNDHSGGGHYVQTGKRWQIPIGGGFNVTPNDWPAIGSVVEYLEQQRPGAASRDMSAYAVVPDSLGRLQEYSTPLRRPGETAGWLGRAYDPLTTRFEKRDKKDMPYFRDCTDEELDFRLAGLEVRDGMTLDRLNRRASLLDQFNDQRTLADDHRVVQSLDRFRQRALALVSSEKVRRAFDVRQEPAPLRDRYGRHLFGQATLLARRLVESGVRYVTVHYDACDGYSWDSHVHSDDVKKFLLPSFDQALAALLTDLDERSLLDETLVVALGEMGRTPQANGSWGRQHWSTLFPAVLAGAGVRGGTVWGESDKDAGYALHTPFTPEDLAATIYSALGIDPDLQLPDAQGRPTSIVSGGRPLRELFT